MEVFSGKIKNIEKVTIQRENAAFQHDSQVHSENAKNFIVAYFYDNSLVGCRPPIYADITEACKKKYGYLRVTENLVTKAYKDLNNRTIKFYFSGDDYYMLGEIDDYVD